MFVFRRFLLVAFVTVPILLFISLSLVYNSLNTAPSNILESSSSQQFTPQEYVGQSAQSAEVSSDQLLDLQREVLRLRKRILELEHSREEDRVANSKVIHRPNWKQRVKPSGLQKRILITGGAGFVGSHLLDRLIGDGHNVIVVDNFYTGRRRNIEHWFGHPQFELLEHDIVAPLFIDGIDQIYHLASPASPPHYMRNAVKTIKINSVGTLNILGLAKRVGARILVASTSEVYGDPEVHPQSESYFGNVNPIGPRSCYDEGKRVAESLTYAYAKQAKLDVRVARIFNTYGPRMHVQDGRVVSNFITQALQDQPLTVYGGEQTRSFQYISDLISGLIALMESNYTLPVNIGNPEEYSINQLASMVIKLVHGDHNATRALDTGVTVPILYSSSPEDDPRRRRPDITLASRELSWKPRVSATDGLRKTIEYFRDELRTNHPDDANEAHNEILHF